MNKFKLILKGVLLYTTAFAVTLFISGIDAVSFPYIILSLVILFILGYLCTRVISRDELETLTLCKHFGINIKED